MPNTLIKNAAIIVTMDSARSELQQHDILVQNGVIAAINQNITPPDNADIIHGQGYLSAIKHCLATKACRAV